MAGGRPTDYRPEFAQEMLDFFGDGEAVSESEDKSGRVVMKPLRLPTFERFASDINVAKSTLYDWAERKAKDTGELMHPEFAYAFTRCRQIQADMLMQGGLFGSYNPVISKMLLAANHNIVEKTVQEHTGKDGKDLIPPSNLAPSDAYMLMLVKKPENG